MVLVERLILLILIFYLSKFDSIKIRLEIIVNNDYNSTNSHSN